MSPKPLGSNNVFVLNPAIQPSTHPFIHPFIHPPIHSSAHPPIHSSTHSFIHPSIHPPIHPSIHPSIHPPLHSSIHPPMQLLCMPWLSQQFATPLPHPSTAIMHCSHNASRVLNALIQLLSRTVVEVRCSPVIAKDYVCNLWLQSKTILSWISSCNPSPVHLIFLFYAHSFSKFAHWFAI